MQLPLSSSLLSGLPVRHLIRTIDYKAASVDEEIALGLVFETRDETLEARRNSHLTNSTPRDHQIRYPLRDRVNRSLVKLASGVAAKMNFQGTVRIAEDDFVSLDFFKALPGAQIELVDFTREPAGELLTDAERRLAEWLMQPELYMPQILKKARERMYASDYRTAYKIFLRLPDSLKSDDVYHMMGLCTNFFGRTEESESHFYRGLTSNNRHSQVRAAYVMSMLYLRMHKKERQSLETAEELLQLAYQVLEKHREIPDWTFHRVFNRNGYALCLYRRGKVQEALDMLEAGIQTLKDNFEGANRLHQSVLIYNAVQCLRTLKKYEDCEKKCVELLDIDPTFPEYHLEQARAFLDQNKNEKALSSIKKAIYLDAFVPEAYALEGFAYLQANNIHEAAESYRRAVVLKETDNRLKLDLGYCLSELGAQDELRALLSSIDQATLTVDEREGYQALLEDQ